MKNFKMMFAALLMCFTFSAVTNAQGPIEELAPSYDIGDFLAVGVGDDYEEASADLLESWEEQLDEIRAEALLRNQEVVDYYTVGSLQDEENGQVILYLEYRVIILNLQKTAEIDPSMFSFYI